MINRIAEDLVKKSETYVRGPYLCPAGIPTSGYGHAWRKGETPIPLDSTMAEDYLRQDLLKAYNAMIRLSPILLWESEERQAAIIDFIFNLGAGAYQVSTLRRKINIREWEQTPAQIKRWVYAVDPKTGISKKLKGLIIRRGIEAVLLKT